MSTEPDPWDEPDPPAEPSRSPQPPGITRAAGFMWMAMGVVFLFFTCLNIVMSAVLAAQLPNRPANGTESYRTCLGFCIGAALLAGGRNLTTGQAKDVVGSSILAILLGLFYGGVGVAAFFFLAQNEVLAVVGAGICFLIALGCIIPAVLALSGRAQYLAWRASRGDRRRRRRRRYEDEEDERDDEGGSEGRPWGRGRGDA